jgi:hypothetical protein
MKHLSAHDFRKSSICISFFLIFTSAVAFESPVFAKLYSKTGRGGEENEQNIVSIRSIKNQDSNEYEIHYNVKSSSSRITGSGTGFMKYGVLRGKFSENHSDGSKCQGNFISQYTDGYLSKHDIQFFITGGRGCKYIGEMPSVSLIEYAGTAYRGMAILHDPSDRPLERLNIRKSPNGKISGQGLSGDVILIEAREKDWVLVRKGSLIGWVHESLIILNN